MHAAEGRKSKKQEGVDCTVTETTLGLLPCRLCHAAALGLLVRVCGKVWQSEYLGKKTFSGHPTPPLQPKGHQINRILTRFVEAFSVAGWMAVLC